MATAHEALRFPGTLAAFERAAADFRTALDHCGISGRPHNRAEVVFEEVVTNIVRHGSAGERPGDIDVLVARHDGRLVLTFDDNGRPFNPLDRPAPAAPASLPEAPVGGLGILLVRKLSTDVRYERTADDRNRLIVTLAAT